MSILVFGLDGLDYDYVRAHSLLSSLDVQHLDQDLEGANALYTYRVWPSIFASDNGGASEEGWDPYIPSEPYIWEEAPAAVMLAPVPVETDTGIEKSQWNNDYQDEFPGEFWKESWAPAERLDDGLDHLESGVGRALDDNVPLVIATSRIPDMLSHHYGDSEITHNYIERACDLAERMCNRADDYMVVSDHGIDMNGPGGLEDHTRRAVFASSFADFDTMSELIDNFKSNIRTQMNAEQMEALGYI